MNSWDLECMGLEMNLICHCKKSPTYHTYNETDFQLMNSQYDYYGNAGYDKPNVGGGLYPGPSYYYHS